MQFQKLVLSAVLSLAASTSVLAKGSLPEETKPIESNDTVICYAPGAPGTTTTLVFGSEIFFDKQSIFVDYFQEGFFTPLTMGDHAGSEVDIEVKKISTRTHVGKEYKASSDDGVLNLKMTEITYLPSSFPLGIEGAYLNHHTGVETDLNCQIIEAYNSFSPLNQ